MFFGTSYTWKQYLGTTCRRLCGCVGFHNHQKITLASRSGVNSQHGMGSKALSARLGQHRIWRLNGLQGCLGVRLRLVLFGDS